MYDFKIRNTKQTLGGPAGVRKTFRTSPGPPRPTPGAGAGRVRSPSYARISRGPRTRYGALCADARRLAGPKRDPQQRTINNDFFFFFVLSSAFENVSVRVIAARAISVVGSWRAWAITSVRVYTYDIRAACRVPVRRGAVCTTNVHAVRYI